MANVIINVAEKWRSWVGVGTTEAISLCVCVVFNIDKKHIVFIIFYVQLVTFPSCQ